MRYRVRLLAGALFSVLPMLGLAAAASVAAQERLTVWLPKGDAAEDAVLAGIAERFQQRSGVSVALSLVPAAMVAARLDAAQQAQDMPDIAFGDSAEAAGAVGWASRGRLEELGDLMAPQRERYFAAAYDSAMLPGPNGKRGYYGLPLRQQGLHIAYWADMVQEAGFSPAEIPQDWKGYWSFWCDKVQPALRAKGQRVYGMAQPAGAQGREALLGFVAHLYAHDALPFDRDGKLIAVDARAAAAQRAGLAAALRDYAEIMQKGCTPPGSLAWSDAENDRALLARRAPMTWDSALGMGGAVPENLRIGTWPARPDGKPLAHPVRVGFAVLFTESRHKPRAREFLAYLAQPDNVAALAEASGGRWFPALREVAERPFWRQDDRRAALYLQFTKQPAAALPFVYSARLAPVQAEALWHRAVSRVVLDKQMPEQAADEMAARLRQLLDG